MFRRRHLTSKQNRVYNTLMNDYRKGMLDVVSPFQNIEIEKPSEVFPYLLKDKLNSYDCDQTETSQYLNISKATLNYWLIRYGIKIEKVALSFDETIEIKLTDKN